LFGLLFFLELTEGGGGLLKQMPRSGFLGTASTVDSNYFY